MQGLLVIVFTVILGAATAFAAEKAKSSETVFDVLIINNSPENAFKIALDSFYSRMLDAGSPKNRALLYDDTMVLVPHPNKSQIGTIAHVVLVDRSRAADISSASVVLRGSEGDSWKDIISHSFYDKNGAGLDIKTRSMDYVFTAKMEGNHQKWSFQRMTTTAFSVVSVQIGSPPYKPCGVDPVLDISDNANYKACGYYTVFKK